MPLAMMNRHGLIAGATGTGKTKSLQLIAEQLSNAGVPVLVSDVKGDLSGISRPGQPSDGVTKRTGDLGIEWSPAGFPVTFLALGGIGTGVPVRATVSAFGPQLLAKVMDANETQFLGGTVFDALNSAVSDAAAAAGAFFVDISRVTEGHDVCADDPWINCIIIDGFGAAAESLHPTVAAHAAIGAAHHAHDLVSEDAGRARDVDLSVHQVEICAADAARPDVDQELVPPGGGLRNVGQAQRLARLVENHGAQIHVQP